MLRSQLIFAVFLSALAIPQDGVQSLLPTPTQQTDKSSPIDEPAKTEQARIKAEVAEIMAIRQQLGGGISEQLKGISVKMPVPEAIQVPEAKSPMALDEAFAKQLAEESRRYKKVQQKPAGESWELVAAATPISTPDHNRIKRIRKAARMLEEAASLLEDVEDYDQADQVRKTAGQLWRSARNP